MKQKIMISKSEDGKQITITEHGEIDKEMFSVLSEGTYEVKLFKTAKEEGVNALINAFRTRNFFPPISTAAKIVEGVENCLQSEDNETIEVFIDDNEILTHGEENLEIIDDLDDDHDQLDDLLDDTVDVYDENISVRKINSSIKVDDDELMDDNGDV